MPNGRIFRFAYINTTTKDKKKKNRQQQPGGTLDPPAPERKSTYKYSSEWGIGQRNNKELIQITIFQ